jgi:hypothetical protein
VLWSQPQQGQQWAGRQLQSVLTKEVKELVEHGELVAELMELHQHEHDWRRDTSVGSRTGRSSRAQPRYGGYESRRGLATPTCRMSSSQLAVHAAWHMEVQVGLLQPVIGRSEAPEGRRPQERIEAR